MHGRQPLPTLDASVVQDVRKELCDIRDKVNVLIDAIDRVPKMAASSSSVSRVLGKGDPRVVTETTSPTQQTQPHPGGVKTEGVCTKTPRH